MAFNKDSITGTVGIALVLCLVCSVIVAGSAVSLSDLQKQNKTNEKRVAVLQIAGVYDAKKTVDEQFENVTARVVNLEEGRYANEDELAALKAAGYNPASFDQYKAAKDPAFSHALKSEEDPSSIKRLGKFANVFLVKLADGSQEVVVPVHGYGLWSTLYGFIALKDDLNTVVGLGFYSHAETPGLGGEVDNPKWKALWPGKKLYKDGDKVALTVIKGHAEASDPYHVDGLSGASLTSRGVDHLVKFWLGEQGFGKFITNLKAQGV